MVRQQVHWVSSLQQQLWGSPIFCTMLQDLYVRAYGSQIVASVCDVIVAAAVTWEGAGRVPHTPTIEQKVEAWGQARTGSYEICDATSDRQKLEI